MTTALRPLTLGELLDRAFSLYRQNLIVFIGIVALPNLILLAFQILNTTLVTGTKVDLTRLLTTLVTLFGVLLVSMVTLAVSQAATIIAVSALHLDQPVSIREAFAAIWGRVIGLCLITLACGVLIFFWFLMLVLPGIFFALRWSLVIPAAVLERLGLRAAMARSAALVEGQYGRVFMIYFLYFLLVLVLSSVWEIPVFMTTVLKGVSETGPPLWTQIVLQIGAFITQCLVGPLLTIALALAYYDARVRKEAFDLEHMLSQLGPAPAGTPPPAVAT
jgi:hypothetical protein